MRVLTVLTSRTLHGAAPEFKPSHVQALQAQIAQWAPFASFECLTDMRIPGVTCRPLKRKWPGWWSKMELFDPELRGDFLYMDLDTVIVGPLDDFENSAKATILRDFYRDGKPHGTSPALKEGLQSSLMFLPEAARHGPWDDFTVNPQMSMKLHASGGDQRLLEPHYMHTADRWQDVLPAQVVSWKVNCQLGVPPGARVVCFHGKPRPWQVGKFLELYRE